MSQQRVDGYSELERSDRKTAACEDYREAEREAPQRPRPMDIHAHGETKRETKGETSDGDEEVEKKEMIHGNDAWDQRVPPSPSPSLALLSPWSPSNAEPSAINSSRRSRNSMQRRTLSSSHSDEGHGLQTSSSSPCHLSPSVPQILSTDSLHDEQQRQWRPRSRQRRSLELASPCSVDTAGERGRAKAFAPCRHSVPDVRDGGCSPGYSKEVLAREGCDGHRTAKVASGRASMDTGKAPRDLWPPRKVPARYEQSATRSPLSCSAPRGTIAAGTLPHSGFVFSNSTSIASWTVTASLFPPILPVDPR